jgi:hypothetical protein
MLKLSKTKCLGLFVLFPNKIKLDNILELRYVSDECIMTLLLLMLSCCVCMIRCFYYKTSLRNHSIIFLRTGEKNWASFGHYIRCSCHVYFRVRAGTLKGLWTSVGVCCVAEVRSFGMWFASIETLASVITSTRDREVKLHWTVHGQLMLMHKSDTRDIWKDAQVLFESWFILRRCTTV